MNRTLASFSMIFYKEFVAYTTQRLQALGLNFGSMPFLLYAGKHAGCTPTELTKGLHMDWGHTQRSLDRLAQEGFLQREKEGRTHHLTLTAAGEEAFGVCHQVFDEWDARKMAVLSDEEQAQLLGLLEKVRTGGKGESHE